MRKLELHTPVGWDEWTNRTKTFSEAEGIPYCDLLNLALCSLAAKGSPQETCALRNLTQEGADVDCAIGIEGNTPLHYSCKNSHVYHVNALLELGASVDARNLLGHSALHDACAGQNSRPWIASLLLRHGADPSCAQYILAVADYVRQWPAVEAKIGTGCVKESFSGTILMLVLLLRYTPFSTEQDVRTNAWDLKYACFVIGELMGIKHEIETYNSEEDLELQPIYWIDDDISFIWSLLGWCFNALNVERPKDVPGPPFWGITTEGDAERLERAYRDTAGCHVRNQHTATPNNNSHSQIAQPSNQRSSSSDTTLTLAWVGDSIFED